MRKLICILLLLLFISIPAQAEEFTAPEAPEDAQQLMPHETTSFGEGLWHVITAGFSVVHPNLSECLRVCFSVFAVAMLLSFLRSFKGSAAAAVELAGAVTVGCILLEPANSLVQEAVQTVTDLSQYGKLLLPVMTGALAAEGGGGTAVALYTATAVFNALLGSMISKLLVPIVYIFLAVSVVRGAAHSDMLDKLSKGILSVASKGLRVILYVFTGYLTVTGVVGGAADQMSIKAAKLTISGMVPVVGSIMADASETILVSAGVVKGAAGVYGLLSLIAIVIGPFLNVGLQYLALKLTASVCSMFSGKEITGIIRDFGSAMGLLLAMTGTMCLLLLISTVCFMKGVG